MTVRWRLLGVVGITLLGAEAQAEGPTWRLVPEASWLVVRLEPKASSLFAGLAHPHVVRAMEFSGELAIDPQDVTGCALRLVVPTQALRVDHPDDRRRVGLKGGPDEDDRRTILEHLRADDQLDVERYPTITFTSVRCRADGAVEGELTIRGKTKRVILPMKIELNEPRISAKGEVQLRHSDFGFEPYSAALGTIGNAEALRFEISLVAERVTRP